MTTPNVPESAGRPRTWRVPGLRALGRAAATLGLAATMLVPAVNPAAAQVASVNASTYQNETYGWSLSWDDTVFTPTQEFGDLDLVLIMGDSSTTVMFMTTNEYNDDPVECFSEITEVLESEPGVSDFFVLETNDGEPILFTEPGRAYGAFGLTYTMSTGEVQHRVNAINCQVLVPGESMLAALHVSLFEDFVEDFPYVDELYSSVEVASTQPTTPRRGRRGEASAQPSVVMEPTPSASGRRGRRGEATAEPSVVPTEAPSASGRRGRRGDPTPEPVNAVVDDAPPGVSGNVFISSEHGYELAWDAREWEPLFSLSDAGEDILLLMGINNQLSIMIYTGQVYDGDALTCVAGTSDEIANRDNNTGVRLLEGDQGPIAGVSDDESFAWAVYLYEQAGVQNASYVACIALGDGQTVIQFEGMGSVEAFAADAEAFDDVLNTLLLP